MNKDNLTNLVNLIQTNKPLVNSTNTQVTNNQGDVVTLGNKPHIK